MKFGKVKKLIDICIVCYCDSRVIFFCCYLGYYCVLIWDFNGLCFF